VSIILLNDDDTYMSYVVKILVKIFEMSEANAESTMPMAHKTGDAVVGIYSKGLAEELLGKVRKMNKANGESLEFRIVK
jgi:ATP-dependent Clp protease adaptor protein ClpS